MFKFFIKLGFLFLVFFMSSNTGYGAGSGTDFGGQITQDKSSQIKKLEDSNYKCMVIGSTMDVETRDGKKEEFYIPAAVKSSTNKQIKTNQDILLKYTTQVPIICIYQGMPIQIQTVMLKSVRLYGNGGGGF